MITRIAIFGAAGKMGTRISAKLIDHPEYELLYVEAGHAGLESLRERGVEATPGPEAAGSADVVVLAVPDRLVERVSATIAPQMKAGALMISLDPAAPLAGDLPDREDIGVFVVHPCHPPIFKDEPTHEAQQDYFGGIARQSIVCALMRGPESDYCRGEAIAKAMFAPILRSHRITVYQMALLEPAVTETLQLTCGMVIKEAMDDIIEQGVPEQAAQDFVMGHFSASLGIVFGYIDAVVSDGAKLSARRAMGLLFKPDWKDILSEESVQRQVRAITHPEEF